VFLAARSEMTDLATLVSLATLASAMVGVIGLIGGVYFFQRQSNAQVFLEYTNRYEEVMDRFPPDGRRARFDLNASPPPASQDLTLAVLRYINLCSEEYYLCRSGYLSTRIWRIWEDELKRTLRSPLVRREWVQLEREFQAYPEFVEYVRRSQDL
jgi:hypothetical protein